MKITKSMLEQLNACLEGKDWFDLNFPEGGEYQEVLDKLGAENNYSYAEWLMSRIPADDSVLEVDEIKIDGSLFFAGKIVVKKTISVTGWLRAGGGIEAGDGIEAGWGIEAGRGIEAGEGIEAGWGIKAGGGIEAGEDWGIFAGIRIQLKSWSLHAKVIAKTRPQNLISGCWVDPENTEEEK